MDKLLMTGKKCLTESYIRRLARQ